MFKSKDFLTRSSVITECHGIYIAQPIGSRMRVIDKRRADIMPSVNDAHIKFGKAHNLKRRFKDYYYDNDGDVEFTPIIICKDYTKDKLKDLEKHIKSKLKNYQMRNPKTNRPLEWLEGISYVNLKDIIIKSHNEFERLASL